MNTKSAIENQFWDYSDVIPNTNVTSLPTTSDLLRDQSTVLITYWILFLVGATGNLRVLTTLVLNRRQRSRVDMLMTHLTTADVLVTCVIIPLEVSGLIIS